MMVMACGVPHQEHKCVVCEAQTGPVIVEEDDGEID